jgi:putative peptidoglycan lipid II flippase
MLGSSIVVGIGTMTSRVLGLLRDITMAHVFGAGGSTDAFLIAFKIPNFLRRLFAEGAFSQAFVPVLAEYREKGGDTAVRDLVAHVQGWLGAWLIVVTALLMLLAPYIGILFAPGYWYHAEAEKLLLTSEFIRIVSPYLLFISLTALAGSLLNTYQHFALPALTPVLLNISLIGASVISLVWYQSSIHILAWGVVVAGALQLLAQLPLLTKEGLLVRPRWQYSHPGLKKIRLLMIPALFGVSVSQINLLLDTVLASLLQDGSVAWLYYSDRLSELPLGVFGIAIATVVLPALSANHASADSETFSETQEWAIRMVCLLGIPASGALILLAWPLIATIFLHGEMTLNDVDMASHSLAAYGSGLLAFMLVKVLAPGFFARQDTKTPVRIAIYAMVANMMFNLMLVFWLGHVGLALATSLSAWLNAGLLYLGLRSEISLRFGRESRVFVGKVVLATLLMLLVVFWLNYPASWWQAQTTLIRALWMGLLVSAGLVSFVVALAAMGIRLRHLRH